jgi:hypothetical protein
MAGNARFPFKSENNARSYDGTAPDKLEDCPKSWAPHEV